MEEKKNQLNAVRQDSAIDLEEYIRENTWFCLVLETGEDTLPDY